MSRFREHVWFNLRDLPLFLWRDSSVQHFDTSSGDYVWPTRTNSCVPFQEVAMDDANQLRTWNPALNVNSLPEHPVILDCPVRTHPHAGTLRAPAVQLVKCV